MNYFYIKLLLAIQLCQITDIIGSLSVYNDYNNVNQENQTQPFSQTTIQSTSSTAYLTQRITFGVPEGEKRTGNQSQQFFGIDTVGKE
jgi:hypothetical protein